MSTPIDEALASLIGDLGNDWSLFSINARETRFQVLGPPSLEYKAIIVRRDHNNEVEINAMGEGGTPGAAVADACLKVLSQQDRSG